MKQEHKAYPITRQNVPTMYFIGVTTAQSSIMRLFPLWTEVLGLGHAQLIGIDLPLHADPEQYRQVIAQIKGDPLSLGGLVTTHKIDLLQATTDMFDTLDRYAQLCQEVSCIVKRDGQLVGYARDPITSGQALQHILGPGYWGQHGGHILCLGAGGSGTAITVNLLTQPDVGNRPSRLVIVSRNQPALNKLRAIVQQFPPTLEIDYVLNEDPRENDQLMTALPPGSAVINATGMGKDRPGSPITDAGIFPMRGLAWELNYRGELKFLHQALAQRELRHLNVHDGWHYFVISWIDHIAAVFHVEVTPTQFAELTERAEMIRR
jgi:shikimate 5-dehydrogenase